MGSIRPVCATLQASRQKAWPLVSKAAAVKEKKRDEEGAITRAVEFLANLVVDMEERRGERREVLETMESGNK
jgi:hypothetical protein